MNGVYNWLLGNRDPICCFVYCKSGRGFFARFFLIISNYTNDSGDAAPDYLLTCISKGYRFAF